MVNKKNSKNVIAVNTFPVRGFPLRNLKNFMCVSIPRERAVEISGHRDCLIVEMPIPTQGTMTELKPLFQS
jgi:hypothetical protein